MISNLQDVVILFAEGIKEVSDDKDVCPNSHVSIEISVNQYIISILRKIFFFFSKVIPFLKN
jgi:hypothetical protein